MRNDLARGARPQLAAMALVVATAGLTGCSGCGDEQVTVSGTSTPSDNSTSAGSTSGGTGDSAPTSPEGAVNGIQAMAVCKKLETAGIGEGCESGEARGLAIGATEKVGFKVGDANGQVLRYDDKGTFDAGVAAFQEKADIVGPFFYVHAGHQVVVQISSGADAARAEKAKGIVEQL